MKRTTAVNEMLKRLDTILTNEERYKAQDLADGMSRESALCASRAYLRRGLEVLRQDLQEGPWNA